MYVRVYLTSIHSYMYVRMYLTSIHSWYMYVRVYLTFNHSYMYVRVKTIAEEVALEEEKQIDYLKRIVFDFHSLVLQYFIPGFISCDTRC